MVVAVRFADYVGSLMYDLRGDLQFFCRLLHFLTVLICAYDRFTQFVMILCDAGTYLSGRLYSVLVSHGSNVRPRLLGPAGWLSI